MQGGFGDERVKVVCIENLGIGERANDEGYGLQLCTRFGYTVLVYTERLNVEVVRQVFEATLIGNLRREQE